MTWVLQDEAELMKLPMRLQHTKGQIPFQKEFTNHFTVSSDGTCFNSAQRQQLVKHRMDRSLVVRFHIIRNARIENVGKCQSCMVSKLRSM